MKKLAIFTPIIFPAITIGSNINFPTLIIPFIKESNIFFAIGNILSSAALNNSGKNDQYAFKVSTNACPIAPRLFNMFFPVSLKSIVPIKSNPFDKSSLNFLIIPAPSLAIGNNKLPRDSAASPIAFFA